MLDKIPISAIILTFNEKNNIKQCLESIYSFIDQIIVIDSGSSDITLNIVKNYTNNIYLHPFDNYSKQFSWALINTNILNDWILRLDADERWSEKGFGNLKRIIDSGNIDGVYVKMKIYFMGKWIKHGDFYPNYFLRVFKKSKSQIEDRWMDEHIIVNGKTVISDIDVIESNYDRQKDITLWIDKHNKYSTREAIEYLINKDSLTTLNTIGNFSGNKTERKRWVKENIYNKLPLFIRPFLYFFYRYVFKLGFLDGKEGLIFHLLQGFWYRFLVDTKIYQIMMMTRKEKKDISMIIKELYNIDIQQKHAPK